MANYQLLKADIDKKVYQNGHQEITGENLNSVLNAMVTTLGEGYQFAGVATIDTNPGTPDAKVFYIANGKGTYTNFGGLEVTEDDVVVLYWDSSWHKVSTGIASNEKLTELGTQVIYDVTANNDGVTFASLSALLSSENLSTLIPSAVRCGGMSIRFIQDSVLSSDNKYVQYRLMADEWSINTEDWAIANEGVYIENHEFVYVKTDAEDKILYGIKKDGDFYFGAGCPQQIKDYVEEKISSLSLDEYEDIVAFLGDYLGSDTTLKAMIDGINATKLDKEGLDPDALSSQSTITSHEYIQLTTDSEDKILEGIKTDGTKVIGADVEIGGNATILGKVDIQGATYTLQKNPEWVKVLTDAQNKIIAGVRKNGSVYINKIEGVTDYINEILNALEQIDIDVKSLTSKVNANYKPDLFYNKYGYSPIVRKNGNKPLIYEINNWFNKAVTYPDGTIIYADKDNVIKRVSPDGTVSSLLTVSGATDIRMIWMDSQYNVYVSPWLENTSYAENTGIYKLAYGSSNFTHVLSLYNPSSTVPSETSVNNFSVWTMTEDLEGNLYAGIYGQPYCPYIYKSVDGGNTWVFLKDMSTYAQGGIHIHFIEYNKYDNALYCTVGEINKLFKSIDGGNTWIDIGVKLEYMKSCSIHCVEDGIILGSDYAYWGMMYKVYADGTYRTTAKTLANVIFSIRESDVTGWLYAFGLIDAAVNVRNYYPPEEAIEDEQVLQDWIDSKPSNLAKWREYHNSMINQHPEDAIRPQHSVILISKDRGESWEVLCVLSGTSTGMGGYFRNGEVAVARNNHKTVVISEGKHSYTGTGIDCTGDILIKLNETTIVNPIENIQ